MLHPGIYELLVNSDVMEELKEYPEPCKLLENLDSAETPAVLSRYLANLIRQSMEQADEEGNGKALEIANRLIALLGQNGNRISLPARQLKSLLSPRDERLTLGMKADSLCRPETSLSMSSLFTGAVHEPAMFLELQKEIQSANAIDMLVSFIKFSGLRMILEELGDFTRHGGKLRIITTSYMGATDAKAVEELYRLPNTEIRVS